MSNNLFGWFSENLILHDNCWKRLWLGTCFLRLRSKGSSISNGDAASHRLGHCIWHLELHALHCLFMFFSLHDCCFFSPFWGGKRRMSWAGSKIHHCIGNEQVPTHPPLTCKTQRETKIMHWNDITACEVKWPTCEIAYAYIYIPTSDIFTCQHIFQMPHITIDIFRRSKSA